MSKNPQYAVKIALFFMLAFAMTVWAEVKLRIYLQDGTLQAGNLVVENPDTFVIMTKEGRSEIKKDKIMFINGKTLKQWQERPDKLFSTEIIPSEIPNPAYVNDKAALPAVPSVSNVQTPSNAVSKAPVIVPITKPVAEVAKPAATPVAEKPVEKPVEKPAAVATAATPAQAAAKPVEVAPAKAKPVKQARTPRVRKKAPVAAAAAPAPVVKKRAPEPEPVIPASVIAAVEVNSILAPKKFVRKDYGDYHYQRAMAYEKVGMPGQAIQELHIATVLDRQNPEAIFMLGRLYKEAGNRVHAEKYLNHPLIRKREEVKNLTAEIATGVKKQERNKWILYGATGVGAFAWIPLLVILRKLSKPKGRVITAEELERSLAEEAATETPVSQPEPEILEKPAPVAPPPPPSVAPEPAFMKLSPVPPNSAADKPPVAPSSVQPPIVQKPEVPKEPAPIVDPRFAETTADILKRFQQPPQVPPVPQPLPVSSIKPEPIPLNDSEIDTEALLRLASMVDKAMSKGNAYAVEEKYELARREYRTALALSPVCVEALLGLGYLCFVQGQWELALEHYVKALEIAPNSADAHYGIGRVLLETDRINEAVPEFQKTLAIDPTFDDARDTLTAIGAAV